MTDKLTIRVKRHDLALKKGKVTRLPLKAGGAVTLNLNRDATIKAGKAITATGTIRIQGESPPWPTGPIHSNFLWVPGVQHSCLIPAYPHAQQDARLDRLVAEGYTDVDLGAMNEGDNPFHQSYHVIDAVANPAPLQHALVAARRRRLRVTLWLLLDDWHGSMSLGRAIAAAESIMPWADEYVDRYVPALEWMETFTSDDFHEYVKAIRQRTRKPIYLHCLDEHLGGASWREVNGIYVQYGLNDEAYVADLTEAAVDKWGDRVIAGEFENPTELAESRRLSAVALAHGAKGTAQG